MNRLTSGVPVVCLFLAIFLLLSAILAPAQITNVTGEQSPPIEGAGHDYIKMLNETVNPGVGSVSIRIDVPVPPGRGMTVPFSFGYDSNAALHFTPLGIWSDNLGFLSQGGWSYLLPHLNVTVNAIASQNGQSICYYYTDYMLTDLGGASHGLYISTVQPEDGAGCTTYNGAPNNNLVNKLAGGDAQVQAATTATAGFRYMPAVKAADMDGTVYSFPATTQGFVTSGSTGWEIFPTTIEDRNGNTATFTASQTPVSIKVSDDVGRTALSISGFGATGNTVTVPGMSPYTVTWGTYTESSSFPWVGQKTQWSGCTFAYSGGGGQVTRISAIGLPNGKSYSFQYDGVTGLLNKLIYPSGGYVRYVWGMTSTVFDEVSWEGTYQGGWGECQATYEDFVLQKRFVSFDGVHEVEEQDFAYVTTMSGLAWTQRQSTVTTKDLVRGTSFNTLYTYVPINVSTQPNDWVITNTTPVESEVQYYDTNGSPLRTVHKGYADPRLPPDETDTLDNNQVSYIHNAYTSPSYLAVLTDKYVYDYGSGAHGPLLRQTHYDYATFAPTPIFPSAASVLDRPSDVITYDGNANKMAETDLAYDQTSVSPISATGHDDTNYASGSGVVRGNATTQTVECLQAGCSSSVTTYAYDQTGQVTSTLDPCGNGTCSDMTGTNHTTTYSYSDHYTVLTGGTNTAYTVTGKATNAYLTAITDALGHTSNFTYDFNNGQLTAAKDANGQSMSYIYNDALARPTNVTYPDGGQTEASYNDVAPSPSVTTCELINGTAGATCSSSSPPTGWKTALMTKDGLGHSVQTKLVSDPDGPTFTATGYDGLGETYQVWNPTRCLPPTTNCGTETTWGITTYVYDALGRTKTVTKPDNSVATTTYSGNQTTMSDEIGNQRTNQVDSLGRLIAVWEAPNSTGYNYETQYQYDALNDLLCAVQKGTDTTAFTTCPSASATWRPRTFVYDSLSRLTSASNPESGTISYAYDLNSNMSSKVAPRAGQVGTGQTTTNYFYDVGNRIYEKSYSNPAAPVVVYGYDGVTPTGCVAVLPPTISSPTNLIGRRSSMCAQYSASSWSYDPVGRPLIESRTNKGSSIQNYSATYVYYKNGSLNALTYPSGDVVTYAVGGAGRATQLSDSGNNYVGYSGNSVKYAPQGSLASMTNGHTGVFAGITASDIYNDRLQPILLSASVGSSPIFSLCYDFHLGVAVTSAPCSFGSHTSGDDGNLFQVINNVDSTRSATFAYDPLNRIAQANTITTTGVNCWGEVYTIDTWGNLTNRAGVSGMGSCSTELLNDAPATTKNQLNGPLYDAAGNVTNDGNGNQPTYDIENRIATDAGVTYHYDANGVRMEKSSGTMYWPGPGSETLTETNLTGAINEEYVYFNGERIARVDRPSGTVHYYFSNHLGSASVVTDAMGNNPTQTDYYPFGGVAYSSGSDPNHYKFTGKEHDTESNFDNFGARYFASATGRFMTPDWASRPTTVPYALFGDPQSLNLYTYVRNDPVTRSDDDGHSAAGNWGGCGVSDDCVGQLIQYYTDPVQIERGRKMKPDFTIKIRVDGHLYKAHFCFSSSFLCNDAGQIFAMGMAVGHHGFPRALFRFLPKGAARDFLEKEFVTGPLADKHYFDAAHRAYNKAVEDLLKLDTPEGQQSLEKGGLRAAMKAGRDILDSDNPAIKSFLDTMKTSEGMSGREALERALAGDGEAFGDFLLGSVGEMVMGAAEVE